MLKIIIKPLTEKGKEALKIHIAEKKKQPLRAKFLYYRVVKEEVIGDDFVLTFTPKAEMLLDTIKLERGLMRVMESNGAHVKEDYEIIKEVK